MKPCLFFPVHAAQWKPKAIWYIISAILQCESYLHTVTQTAPWRVKKPVMRSSCYPFCNIHYCSSRNQSINVIHYNLPTWRLSLLCAFPQTLKSSSSATVSFRLIFGAFSDIKTTGIDKEISPTFTVRLSFVLRETNSNLAITEARQIIEFNTTWSKLFL